MTTPDDAADADDDDDDDAADAVMRCGQQSLSKKSVIDW